jgi:hypothetical protein
MSVSLLTPDGHDARDHTGITGVGGAAAVFAGVRVHNDAAQALTSGAWTTITFNSERFDTDAFHSTASDTSRLTVPTGLGGYYAIGGGVTTAVSTTGARFIRILLNGTTQIQHNTSPAVSGFDARLFVSTLYPLDATHFVELEVFVGASINSVVTANSTPEFWMYKVG